MPWIESDRRTDTDFFSQYYRHSVNGIKGRLEVARAFANCLQVWCEEIFPIVGSSLPAAFMGMDLQRFPSVGC